MTTTTPTTIMDRRVTGNITAYSSAKNEIKLTYGRLVGYRDLNHFGMSICHFLLPGKFGISSDRFRRLKIKECLNLTLLLKLFHGSFSPMTFITHAHTLDLRSQNINSAKIIKLSLDIF